MKIVSVPTMRALDQRTIENGTPAETLMERAGVGAFRESMRFSELRLPPAHRQRVTVLAGKGNNGGDAYVAARHFAEDAGLPVTVYSVCPATELTGACRAHAQALPESIPVVVADELPEAALAPGTLVIDGLLGTGASGALRPPYDRLVSQINACGMPVVALDIPSGLDGETGAVASDAVMADLTVTMGLPKAGLLSAHGMVHCGALRCVDIGMPARFVEEAPGCGEATFACDVAPLLTRRARDSHKGTFGHVLVAAGSSQYGGAPFLAGVAALRVGTGLATIALPATARRQTTGGADALIVRAVEDDGTGAFCAASCAQLGPLLDSAQAVVFGPGIGSTEATLPVLRQILRSPLPAVVDADGLRLMAKHPETVRRRAATVLTPHTGELRALLSGFSLSRHQQAVRTEQASAFARKTGAVVVLKGLGTVIAHPDGRWAINSSGDNGLATAGSGDVLAGMLGGLLAQGLSTWDAARLGVFVHGLAAELAPHGSRALIADDLAGLIGKAFQILTPFA